jgi:hypothetical protein
LLICAALAATTALKNLLQGLAVVRGFRFSTFSLMIVVEISKLVFSVLLSMTLKSRSWPSQRDCLLFAIPGLLYMLDNNVVFVILEYIDAAQLSALWNSKTIITAVLMRCLLGRKYRSSQWAALGLLTLGLTLSQMNHLLPAARRCAADDESSHCAVTRRALLIGTLLTLGACSLVSIANVAEERMLKAALETPLYCQNVVLYSWGVFFNVLALVCRSALSLDETPFAGFDLLALSVVGTQAASGILISATFKHVNNIAALFAHAMSMILIAAFTPGAANWPFVAGMGVVVVSIGWFYNVEMHESFLAWFTRDYAGRSTQPQLAQCAQDADDDEFAEQAAYAAGESQAARFGRGSGSELLGDEGDDRQCSDAARRDGG